MNTTNFTIETNQEAEIKHEINVILWHILVSKIFLYWFFEEYYINFIRDWEFSEKEYLRSIKYTEEILSWDNFTDRYSGFEQKADEILVSLEREENLLWSLLESITFNLPYIIGRKEEHWIIENDISDMDFFYDKKWIIVVQNWIKNYISSEINKLKQLIWVPEVKKIRSDLIEWLRTLEILT